MLDKDTYTHYRNTPHTLAHTHTHTHTHIYSSSTLFCASLLTDTTTVKNGECLRDLQIEPTCTES